MKLSEKFKNALAEGEMVSVPKNTLKDLKSVLSNAVLAIKKSNDKSLDKQLRELESEFFRLKKNFL